MCYYIFEMYSKICILILALSMDEIKGVIYYLNDTEFNRMPPVYKLDDYKVCLQNPSDLYCNVDFNLVSDTDSELLNMIHEYSEQKATHYDHSQLTHGVCFTQRCQNYIEHGKLVSKTSLERCLNDTFMKEYGLATQVTDFHCHGMSDARRESDVADKAVALLLLTIFMLNIMGTVYDVNNYKKSKDNNFLLCFSIPRNWKYLTSCKGSKDPRIEYVKSLNGIRCIILFGVIVVHSTWPYSRSAENVHDLELSFYNVRQNVIMTGTLVIQFNFLISGFLLAHNTEIYCEQNDMNWYTVLKGIVVRYFRITPTYAVLIAVSATWLKYLGSGPLWQVSGYVLHSHCRSDWWRNLLYINNYKYNAQCLATSCDIKTLFESNPTFNEVYKMGHTNIPSFIIGMILGYYVYERKKSKVTTSISAKLRCMYWALLPLAVAVMFSGELFYRDAPRDPLFVRVAYAALHKPTFSSLMALLLLGAIFKIENVYRRALEWDVWTVPSRLTYCVFVLHMPLIRLYIGLSHSLFVMSNFNLAVVSVSVSTLSYIAAVPLWLLVESPFTQLIKYNFARTAPKKSA